MNTPLSWIKEYVPDLETTYQEFNDKMTLSGTKVETVDVLDADLEKIVVGKVLKVEKHPDADKLVICQVQVGPTAEDATQIVTGAPNVFEGAVVPVVLDGGRVAGGHDGKPVAGGVKIKKGKLRGIESNGMMCSIEELGSTKDFYPEAPDDGLYIFSEEDNVKPGDDAIEALGFRDAVYEYEITSNRVDCYSVIGIAREAAATYGKEFKLPEIKVKGSGDDVKNYIDVEIKDKDLCKRYCARAVKNVKIGPSPKWMRQRLAKMGIRPINNIVDITNYVMEEYGNPMHAFDLDTIEGHKIIVKRAANGDKFTTLDETERNLDENMLMICDAKKQIGIAGIMGGENSKITDDVSTVIFEGACFDGTNIRLSSKRLGLRTDASGKFEKGLDPNSAIDAVNRACELVEMLGCGEVVDGVIDVYPEPVEKKRVKFSVDKINALLGINISKEEMYKYFKPLELEVDEAKGEIIVPTFRQDLLSNADIAEEVARFYGYDNIPVSLPSTAETAGKISDKMYIENIGHDIAAMYGFSQAMTYSFESPKVYDKLLLPENDELRNAIEILNPLGKDFSIMRTTSMNGMLSSLGLNYSRRNKDVKLYEFANIYIPKQLPITELPDERMQFTLGFYGDGDFFSMKGVVEEYFEKLGMFEKVEYDPNAGKSFLHPGRQANITYYGHVVGYLGEVHPLVAKEYGIGDRAYVAVIDMPTIYDVVSFDRKYESIAKFPAITRDLSMTVPKEILVGSLEAIFAKKGGKLLESYKLFDIYEGEQIKEGYKSVAYSLTFRAKDRSLEDKDVQEVMDKILTALKEKDIELRM